WIDETGNLEILIKYQPQYWFEIGSIATIVTLSCCLVYLIYSWEKDNKKLKMLKKKLKIFIKRKT
ncbi:MAG: hypothetical protein JSV67_07165, partial [Thermoplasmatales archaeon]